MGNKSAQELSSDNSTINDSNNHHGNAGRDIINNYGCEDFYNGKTPRQIDIIKSQRAVIGKLQRQIDRMQDQMEEYQRQFSKAQQIKEQLMQMLLDDRDMLRERFINENSTNNSTHKKKNDIKTYDYQCFIDL